MSSSEAPQAEESPSKSGTTVKSSVSVPTSGTFTTSHNPQEGPEGIQTPPPSYGDVAESTPPGVQIDVEEVSSDISDPPEQPPDSPDVQYVEDVSVQEEPPQDVQEFDASTIDIDGPVKESDKDVGGPPLRLPSPEKSSSPHHRDSRPGASRLKSTGHTNTQPQSSQPAFSTFKFGDRRTGHGSESETVRKESAVSPTTEHPPSALFASATESRRLAIPITMRHFDQLVCERPYRAQELCDLDWTSFSVGALCQNMLTQQWIRKLPIIQDQSPAELVARHLEPVLNKIATSDTTRLAIVDFCAGAGGPTPTFERLINGRRKERGEVPLRFVMSDLRPNVAAWDEHCEKGGSLTYIAEPVDATNPPPSARSVEPESNKPLVLWRDKVPDLQADHPRSTRTERVFRLFNLSFHHFDNDQAKGILRSTMEHSDGMAIVELQDRSIGCMLLLFFNWALTLAVTWFWFPVSGERSEKSQAQNIAQNVHTYTGVLPFILWCDALASCLRTREFEEVMQLVGQIQEPPVDPQIKVNSEEKPGDRYCEIGNWTFSFTRKQHTYPFGYLNMITGIKKPRDQRIDSIQQGEYSEKVKKLFNMERRHGSVTKRRNSSGYQRGEDRSAHVEGSGSTTAMGMHPSADRGREESNDSLDGSQGSRSSLHRRRSSTEVAKDKKILGGGFTFRRGSGSP